MRIIFLRSINLGGSMTDQEQINVLKDENLCLKDELSILELQIKNRLDENVSLVEQIDALKAQVNCLREALVNSLTYREGFGVKCKDTLNSGILALLSQDTHEIITALEATPEQCLTEVKAKVIEEYKKEQAETMRLDLATKIMMIS